MTQVEAMSYDEWPVLDFIAYVEAVVAANVFLTRVIQGHDRERQGFKAAIAQRDATIADLTAEVDAVRVARADPT